MAHLRYQRTVVGYHGCDAAVAEKVLAGRADLSFSRNAYDWLGVGVYLREHGPHRAYEWAVEQARLAGAKVRNPSGPRSENQPWRVLGSVRHRQHTAFGQVVSQVPSLHAAEPHPMPQNRDAAQSRRGDKVLRFRDCAVIDYALSRLLETERVAYQTVRGVFLEGGPAFPGSEIALKSHIQIAVRDPKCVAEFFRPESGDYRGESQYP